MITTSNQVEAANSNGNLQLDNRFLCWTNSTHWSISERFANQSTVQWRQINWQNRSNLFEVDPRWVIFEKKFFFCSNWNSKEEIFGVLILSGYVLKLKFIKEAPAIETMNCRLPLHLFVFKKQFQVNNSTFWHPIPVVMHTCTTRIYPAIRHLLFTKFSNR